MTNFILRVVIFKNSKISSSNIVYNMRTLKNQTVIKYLTATQLRPVFLNRIYMKKKRTSRSQIILKLCLRVMIIRTGSRIPPILCIKAVWVDRMIWWNRWVLQQKTHPAMLLTTFLRLTFRSQFYTKLMEIVRGSRNITRLPFLYRWVLRVG